MPTSSSTNLRRLQEQLGGELVTELVAGVDDADLEAALLDENDPLARGLHTAVQAAVDAGRNLARQIVAAALERELMRRRGEP